MRAPGDRMKIDSRAAALAMAVLAVVVWQYGERLEQERQVTDALAVSQVDDATRQRWVMSMQVRVKQRIAVDKNMIGVRDSFTGDLVWAPITAISVRCENIMGIAIVAPGAEEYIWSPSGALVRQKENDQPPFRWDSVAGKKLADHMCTAVSRAVSGPAGRAEG